MNTTFSVLVCCHGRFPHYSLRAVTSIVAAEQRGTFDLHVGCSDCCEETISALRKQIDEGRIDSIVQLRRNINKDPMMRVLVELARGEYVLWLDDDSHLAPGWDGRLVEFLDSHAPFDVAGHVFYWHKNDDYRRFLRQRPWYRGDDAYLDPGDHQQRTWFATGGLFVARTEFLRQHDFPDRGMVKKQDDVLLGDLISQQHGKLIGFSNEFMECVAISDGDRRGEGEGDDGWVWRPE